jgi:hypothetical protein
MREYTTIILAVAGDLAFEQHCALLEFSGIGFQVLVVKLTFTD